MSNEDVAIAKALNAGLRRLLVAAFVHQRETANMPGLHEALQREIARLIVRGVTEEGEGIELSTAVRKSLHLFVDAAYREATEARVASTTMQ